MKKFVELLFLGIQHYAGKAYPEPNFEGAPIFLFENGCISLDDPKISSFILVHNENLTAACSLHRSSDCSDGAILAPTEDPSFGLNNEAVLVHSYECELVRPTKGELQGSSFLMCS